MKKILPFILLLYCCSSQKSQIDDYEEIIDNLLRYEYFDTELLILDTEPVRITETVPYHNTIGIENLKHFAELGYLKNDDFKYIYNQIDSSKIIALDSTKFDIKTISKTRFDTLFSSLGTEKAINYLHNVLKVYNVCAFSTPLFSKDRTSVIFWQRDWQNSWEFDEQSPAWRGGYIFVFNKKYGKWRMVEKIGTYER